MKYKAPTLPLMGLLAFLLSVPVLAETKLMRAEQRELLRDALFKNGFSVLAARAEDGEIGQIQLASVTTRPVWQLAQWHSRFPFTGFRSDGSLCVSNAAHWLCLDATVADRPSLTLGVDSRSEYDGKLRQGSSEPWVHLLVQQEIQSAPTLSELASLRLRFEARLREVDTFRPEGHSPSLHAAQFQVVLTLNNTRRDSPGFGDYLWFVVPVYDDRYEVPPEYVAQDFAVTKGKLIFNPGGAAAGLKPLRVGEWQTVDCDLRPWLERALAAAWVKGYLKDSSDPADYQLAHVNLGWEVPGLNRVAMDLRGLSLSAETPRLAADPRLPAGDGNLREWLENMIVFHRFTPSEVSAATGLTLAEVSAATRRFHLDGKQPGSRRYGEPLCVLPYPGGRHPRLGFFDGAVLPQRETKVSIFAPWTDGGYVVVDVPEAIFSNLGLTYLAHTHIPTIWDQQGVSLPHLEWTRHPDGHLTCERALPNGIDFGSVARPDVDGVRFELWLRNGSPHRLTGLHVQNCVMLGEAPGFSSQSLTNKVFAPPYAAARSDDGHRWVITAWQHCERAWGNELVPCIHADPIFPDCDPGDTVQVRGWLSFYDGTDVTSEFLRLETLNWRKP